MKWRKFLFAGLEKGKIVKEILLALGGVPAGAKKVTYLSNGIQYRQKLDDGSWRMCRIWKRPQGDWAVEFWNVKLPRMILQKRLRNLDTLRRVVDAGMS